MADSMDPTKKTTPPKQQPLPEGTNTGVIIVAPKPGDYVAGGYTGIPYLERVLDWRPYLPAGERQRKRFDTMACVTFSAMNILEMQLNWMLATGLIPHAALGFFTFNGYIVNGKFELSDRFIAKLSGTTTEGNTLINVWTAVDDYGLIPESRLPFTETMTRAEYYEPISQELLALGEESKKYIEVLYEWVARNPTESTRAHLTKHLKQAPLQLVSKVCAGWNKDNPVKACGPGNGHATTLVHRDDLHRIFDHYEPFNKNLANDYGIPYVMKGVITFKEVQPMNKFWAQANDVISKFTKKDNNDPLSEQLAHAWEIGDGATTSKIINDLRVKYPMGGGNADAKLAQIENIIHG